MTTDDAVVSRGSSPTLAVNATPETESPATVPPEIIKMPHEMLLTFVLDQHGDLSAIRDKNGRELPNMPTSEKLKEHVKGVVLKAVIPMTLMMHTDIEGTKMACCIPVTGGWRYINCENAKMPHEMSLTFVVDEHGDLLAIRDKNGRELPNKPASEKLKEHVNGVVLKAVIPMTLIMHTDVNGTETTCCIPSTGGWRYINC